MVNQNLNLLVIPMLIIQELLMIKHFFSNLVSETTFFLCFH